MYRFLGSCAGLVLMWAMGLFIFGQFIPFEPHPSESFTDGMVIFTGGKTRVQTALTLFEQKKSKYLLISGANPDSPLQDILGQEADNPDITLGYQAADTIGNAEETAAWAKARDIKTLRLITSNYHMLRSLFELRHLLPGVEIIPEPVVADNFNNPRWWRSRFMLMHVIYEYNKFLFAVIRHSIEDVKQLVARG